MKNILKFVFFYDFKSYFYFVINKYVKIGISFLEVVFVFEREKNDIILIIYLKR